MQLNLEFNVVHRRENNPVSQANLNLRREDFARDCWNCLKAMLNGERLTTKDAMNRGLSGHLPRRIKDLHDRFKVDISKQWVNVDGKRSHIEYYMTQSEIQKTRNRIIEEMN